MQQRNREHLGRATIEIKELLKWLRSPRILKSHNVFFGAVSAAECVLPMAELQVPGFSCRQPPPPPNNARDLMLEKELAEIRHQLEELSDRLESDRARARAVALVRRGLKNPRQLNLMFMGGLTLGEMLRKRTRTDSHDRFAAELGLTREQFQELLEDRFLPDPQLSERLVFQLNKKFGLKYSEVMICKAHTYSKIKHGPDLEAVKALARKKLGEG